MGRLIIILFSLFEIIPGITLICAVPPKGTWTRPYMLACVCVAAVSITITILGIPYLPLER